MAIVLVAFLRLAAPLLVLRFPFFGALAAIAADAADIIIVEALGQEFGSAERYHAFDKVFDIYWLSFAVYASRRWPEAIMRKTALALYLWRAGGLVAFEVTGIRQIIFFAPNILENFYLLVAGLHAFRPRLNLARTKILLVLLLIAGLPKIAQEYVMHFIEFPTWSFIKHTILGW